MKKRLAAALFIILVIAGASWTWTKYAHTPREIAWQGWVEGNYLFVGPDDPGRVTALKVDRGHSVKRGEPLFSVENDLQAAELRQAEAALSEAEARFARAEAAQQRPEEILVLEAQKERLEAALDKSRPELARAKDLVANGISPQSRLDEAGAALASDEAAVAAAKRQIEVARLKARTEDIVAARAIVEQAKQRVAAARVSLDRRAIVAPADGVVQDIFYRQGEVVAASRPVLSLLPPGNMKLLFFVPEPQLVRMSPGQKIDATCDGCTKPISATITFVSREAEFTPPVIFSREERSKLVFRIEAQPNDGAQLHVGLPVTVTPAAEGISHVGSRE